MWMGMLVAWNKIKDSESWTHTSPSSHGLQMHPLILYLYTTSTLRTLSHSKSYRHLTSNRDCQYWVRIIITTARWLTSLPSQELCHYVLPEGKGNTPIVLSPPYNILVGVSPQQITQQTGVRNVCYRVVCVYVCVRGRVEGRVRLRVSEVTVITVDRSCV